MTFAELRQEVIERGYDYIPAARIGTFVQRSYRAICAARNWPFLEATATGTAPMVLGELRKVLSVTDTTNERPLRGVTRQWLAACYPNLTEAGTPLFWHLEDNTLSLYPTDEAVELEVTYKKRPAALADSDEPLVPSEWQYLIVDLAVVHCLRDDDEYDEARALKADTEKAIREEMTPDLMGRNKQNPGTVLLTGLPGDYLR